MIAALLLAAAAAAAPRYAALDDASRAELVAAARAKTSAGERLVALTTPFVGTHYTHSPLGEGPGEGVDPDPRLRWDEVDCLTFIETAMALAAAPDAAHLLPVLDDIRYAAPPASFLNRNHFVEAQWLPNNLAKGYLRELSRDFAGPLTARGTKTYSPERWTARRKLGDMPLSDADVPRGTFSFDYVPFELLRARRAEVPAGTLMFVVRKDFYSQPTRITHVGFVLDVGGRRVFRHASQTPFQRVVDEPLDAFLERNSKYGKWPVEGFALYEPATPRDRIAGLPVAQGGPETSRAP